MVSVAVEGARPSNRLCMMVASSRKAADQTKFAAELRAASDQPLPGDLQWVVRDWDGNRLAEGNRRVTVPAGGERLVVEVPTPAFPERLKFAEAEFSLAIPGQIIPKVQAYWLAPHTPHDDPALRPESPFGMGVYLNRFRGADQETVYLWGNEGLVNTKSRDLVIRGDVKLAKGDLTIRTPEPTGFPHRYPSV